MLPTLEPHVMYDSKTPIPVTNINDSISFKSLHKQNYVVVTSAYTSRYGEIPFLSSSTISVASSALRASKSYRLLSVALYTTSYFLARS